METEPEIDRKKKIISVFSGSRIMFNQMDKFQRWVVNRDVDGHVQSSFLV
jgi:hypothetical protein